MTGSLIRFSILTLFAAIFSAASFAQVTGQTGGQCGSLTNAYGPFDYTNLQHRQQQLPIVERHHFTDRVFRLESGQSTLDPTSDIDYTLRAFPNHHLALDAMARLHRERNAERLPKATYSLSCYFDRARRMAPQDGIVLMIEAIHDMKRGRVDAAETLLLDALALEPDSPEIPYNLGLLYLEKKDYDRAAHYAEEAYAKGYPLPGLRNRLLKLGRWPGDTQGHEGN